MTVLLTVYVFVYAVGFLVFSVQTAMLLINDHREDEEDDRPLWAIIVTVVLASMVMGACWPAIVVGRLVSP